MKSNLLAIYMALQTVPFLALAAALPYTLAGYLRTKSVNVWRCTYFYTFVLYVICAYLMTVLPIPSQETLAVPVDMARLIQLVPFQNIAEITWENLFTRHGATLFFNLVLTIPLGFFLRFLFGFKLGKTALISFLAALFFEVSQLTGVFFIFPRPWRIFDVDDLFLNTLGGVIGYFTAPLLARILPKEGSGNKQRLAQGSEVSFIVRAIAGVIDFLTILTGSLLVIRLVPFLHNELALSLSLERFPKFFLLFMAVAAVYGGLLGPRTLGNRLTGLHLTTADGRTATRRQSLFRLMLKLVFVSSLPFWILFAMSMCGEEMNWHSMFWVAVGTVLMLSMAHHLLEIMFNAITHGSSMFYDRLTKTCLSYGSSRKAALFGAHVLEILPMEFDSVDRFSDRICETLREAGVEDQSVTRVRLMAECVLLDWLNAGLKGSMCELRLDRHFHKKALILSVPGADKTPEMTNSDATYASLFSRLTVQMDYYRAAQKNICIIHIP